MKHHHSPNTYSDTLIVQADRSPRSDVKKTLSTKTEAPLTWSPDVGSAEEVTPLFHQRDAGTSPSEVLQEQSSCVQVKMLRTSSGVATGTTGVEE